MLLSKGSLLFPGLLAKSKPFAVFWLGNILLVTKGWVLVVWENIRGREKITKL